MRDYNYDNKWEKLLTPEIVLLLAKIHECKGQQNLFIEQKADTLVDLLEIAKIQSTEASNRIEGIFTSNDRLKLLALDKTMPNSRNELEIAGYRDVLDTIHKNHDYIPVKTNMVLQLHRDLYKYIGASSAGSFKTTDNVITEMLADGTKRVRFQPVESWETPEVFNELCKSYNEIISRDDIEPLLIVPMFILDFLCIHPFNDGNGRLSRILTLLLLYRLDYIVGKYISIEKIIEESKETYYEVLEASSFNWHENENTYEPFVKYTLGIILLAYKEFENRVETMVKRGLSKPERVAEMIKQTLGTITKRELMDKAPDISDTTIHKTLNALLRSNKIIKIGGGRYTKYVWNNELED